MNVDFIADRYNVCPEKGLDQLLWPNIDYLSILLYTNSWSEPSFEYTLYIMYRILIARKIMKNGKISYII